MCLVKFTLKSTSLRISAMALRLLAFCVAIKSVFRNTFFDHKTYTLPPGPAQETEMQIRLTFWSCAERKPRQCSTVECTEEHNLTRIITF